MNADKIPAVVKASGGRLSDGKAGRLLGVLNGLTEEQALDAVKAAFAKAPKPKPAKTEKADKASE